MEGYYTGICLLLMWDGSEPQVVGPYPNEDSRDEAALEFRYQHGDDLLIYKLYDDDSDKPRAETYPGGFFDEGLEVMMVGHPANA